MKRTTCAQQGVVKMKTIQQLLDEKYNRIRTAISLGKPDRVPVVLMADAFCANHLGVKLSEYCMDVELSNITQMKSLTSLGEIDGVEKPHVNALQFSAVWLSKMKIPGRDLPEGVLWQVDEAELMTAEDYDTIIDKGYKQFFVNFCKTKLSSKGDVLEAVQKVYDFMPRAIKNYESAGTGVCCPVLTGLPYDAFTGGRTMAKFTRDVFKMPDKVQAAMDVMMIDLLAGLRQQIRTYKPFGVWLSGMRAASEFVSPKIWQRMVFPYIKKIVNTIVEEGAYVFLHFDSNWERDLEYFKELPKGKCAFGSDHATDIFKLKKVLGDHMCIKGDVPASLLTLGTPDEVYNYCTRLISEIGPSGYILAQGCDIPANAKVENVKAMICAATGK
jgi:uroporphyrinogen-III decarboxylase